MTSSPQSDTFLKQFGLFALCAAWLLFGLFGRDPAKPDEPYTFGLILHILQTGDWVVPTLAGEPFVEKPPLFFLVSAAFAKAFSFLLPLHEGARLASAAFVAVSALFLGLTARELNGPDQRWLPPLLLLGSLGFILRAHSLITDLALVAGLSIGFYGLAASAHRAIAGGLWLGTGAGIAFLSKGLLGPGILGITALLLPLFPVWRSRSYLLALAVAAGAILPWLLIWPYALYLRDPALFHEWFWVNNFGRFFGTVRLGPEAERLYYLKNLPWMAFPAWPIAAWALWNATKGRQGGLGQPGIQLPTLAFVITFTVLSAASDARDVYVWPLLLPLALLAARGVDSMPRGMSAALDWFGILTFGLLAATLWLAWTAMLTGVPTSLATLVDKRQPGFVPQFAPLAFILSLALTMLWFALIRPARQSNRRTLINWLGGITLVWGLAAMLGSSYFNYGQTYRSVFRELKSVLPTNANCVASKDLGEPQRAMLHYFENLLTERLEKRPDSRCDWLLVQGGQREEAHHPGNRWEKHWEGQRPGDDKERYRLYRRRDGQ